MKKDITKWIWQDKRYPNFEFQRENFSQLISKIEYNKGLLDGLLSLFNPQDLTHLKTNAFLNEMLNSYEIEGERLKRQSVHSSLLKRFDKNFKEKYDTTRQSEALADVLIDCNENKKPLSLKRLNTWHKALFENVYNPFEKIRIGKFRINDDMKVVSGAIGQEKIHFQAPPCEMIEENIKDFLHFCNTSNENTYIKSAIAHLWFVIIHPYDDGNGRIARAVTDFLLSNKDFKVYSISQAINQDKKNYYEILDKTTNLFYNKTFSIDKWIFWHLKTLNNALELAKQNVDFIIKKTKFWDKCKNYPLNSRQIKVLSKVLEKQNFEGGISTKKYISITKTSKATASRDIRDLVAYGCIKQIPNTSGRNVRYEVVV